MSASVNASTSEAHAPAKTRKSIHEFKIGSVTRRLFDDGKWYSARVMTEPRLVFDNEKRKYVLSRKIKYYEDNQEEWADEDQLNEWAYDIYDEGTKGNEIRSASSSEDDGDSDDDDNWHHKGSAKEDDDDEESVCFGMSSGGRVFGVRKPKKPSKLPLQKEIGHRSLSSPAMSDGRKSSAHAPGKTRKSIHEFKIGSVTRRLFDDGKWYSARVMTEPRLVFDNEKKKYVLSRKIKYYEDNQEEWADEDQLNEWAYNPYSEDTKGNEIRLANSSSSEDDGDGNEEDSNGGRVFRARKPKKPSKISMAITPSPPQKEIGRQLLYSPAMSDGTKSSDTLSEITGSSETSPCTDHSDESDARRRGKRVRCQPETFNASSKKTPPPPCADASGRKNPGDVKQARAEMRETLMHKMGITSEEIDFALDKMSPPYAQNEAFRIILKRRRERGSIQEDDDEEEEDSEKFYPYEGMRIRVPEGGAYYHGTVTGGPKLRIPENSKKEVKMWTVKFNDDGQTEDYSFMELLRYRANKPIVAFEGCRGRTMNALELFCGEGIVAQAFCERKFNVNSIDVDPNSYAMMVLDIREVKYEDIGFVPDFIWASPPCTTFTNLSGGKHRNAKEGQFEKTQVAHDHNVLFAQMVCIMRWAKSKNPNLIVVIENPQGQLQNMPMMIEFEEAFGLHKTTVDYCAFERPDKKPTNLWTNDLELCTRLGRFRCSESMCPYFNRIHPIGVRSHKCFNSAAIPIKLAEEVAHYVDSKCYMSGFAYTPKVVLTTEEVDEFNKSLSCKI